jgi:prepilin-type N-terminal cleavage/methylation domain-containing protein
MKLSANFASPRRNRRNGFSLVELLLSLVVLLIITTLAVPVVVRSLQTYQLNSTASQLAGMLKFTKFEAIRQNTPVSCQIQQKSGGKWLIWVDSNGNGQPDGAEPQMIVGGTYGTFTLLPSGPVPNPAAIISTLGPGGPGFPWTVISGSNASVAYDQRGVLQPDSMIDVIYVGSSTNANAGYRAVITLPSGAVQVWTASSTGNWQRVS